MVSKTTKAKKILNLISSEQRRTLLCRRSLNDFFGYLMYIHIGGWLCCVFTEHTPNTVHTHTIASWENQEKLEQWPIIYDVFKESLSLSFLAQTRHDIAIERKIHFLRKIEADWSENNWFLVAMPL